MKRKNPHIIFKEIKRVLESLIVYFDSKEFEMLNSNSKFSEKLNTKIDSLELSIRSANLLSNEKINYVGELCRLREPDLLKHRNFGRRSLNEIRDILSEMGLYLGMNLSGWYPQPKELEVEND